MLGLARETPPDRIPRLKLFGLPGSHRLLGFQKLRSRRGFTLTELLVVLFILAIMLTIATSSVNDAFKRAKLNSTATDLKNFIGRALPRMQDRSQFVWVRLNGRAVEMWGDADGDQVLDAGTGDTKLETYTIPAEISLSMNGAVAPGSGIIFSTNWDVNPADLTARAIGVDYKYRAVNPTTGTQIPGIATLQLTHTDMLPSGGVFNGRLQPPIYYEVRINPLWQASLLKYHYNGSVWQVLGGGG